MARLDPHAAFRELIAARLDRPLTRVESRSLAAHVKKCDACRRVDADYRAQRLDLRALPSPAPPRDMWARTSAALDREVARGARTAWGRRVTRARRKAQPSSALMTTVAALGVVTALAVFQLAPSTVPSTGSPQRPTPFAIDPQPFAFLGLGASDLAVYRMTVSEVCPQTATLDCLPQPRIVRTAIGAGVLSDIQAGNAVLSPSGQQLALVGKQLDGDVIAVVWMPTDEGNAAIPSDSVDSPKATDTPEPTLPPATETASPASATPGATPAVIETPDASPSPDDPTASPAVGASQPPATPPSPTLDPANTETPTPPSPSLSAPPASAVPGLAVLSILEDVRSAGSPPAWSRNGQMLAFSAMPIDGSHGPDVYVWSPDEARARPITDDHTSYFASWSGNRIVVSRLRVDEDGAAVARNFVVDPETLEERRASGANLWLPAVNRQRTQAVAWRGEFGLKDGHPELRAGTLYLVDWTMADPFRETEQEGQELPSGSPAPTPSTDDDDLSTATILPIDPERDPHSAPVSDWQAGWSPDGRVLGVWIADSPGSNWGQLTVFAIDPASGGIYGGEALLGPTLARRGFSLGSDRVAWVSSSEENADGELRIRAWTTDGVGNLRVVSGEQEEVLPAF